MARTRRRRSYRKSRRWNPDAVPAAVAAAPTKTNPHTFIKRLPDGSSVRVTPEGKVTVLDSDGSVHDRWSLKAYEVPRLLRDLKGAKRANKYDYRADAVVDEYHTVSMNPRGHRGHKRKKRGGSWFKRAMRSVDRRVDTGYKGKKTSKSRASYRRTSSTSGRKRKNPAQFPPPYFSAMSNPRRGKKRFASASRAWSRKGPSSKYRRNSPIRKKDARALKRVLRTHHYRCR